MVKRTRKIGSTLHDIGISSIIDIFSPIFPFLKKADTPCLLLPLRLEYRVRNANMLDVLAAPRRMTREENRSRAKKKSHLEYAHDTPDQSEIWFRWYPDADFSERAVSPPSADEEKALDAFFAVEQTVKAETGQQWPDMSNLTLANAWQTLASRIGFHRAVYLVRCDHETAQQDDAWAEKAGRIIGLPDRIRLYAVQNGQLHELGEGSDISNPVHYLPQDVSKDGWVTNFQIAVDKGMGLRLTDPDKVALAIEADWIIAVGISNGDESAQLEGFIKNALAEGRFAFLEQDTPTNNSPEAQTGYEAEPSNSISALARVTSAETGAAAGTDASVLADALGIDAEILLQADGAANKETEAARDMLRVILPGLFASIDSISNEFENQDLIDFLIDHITARGPLPTVRVGRNPYGILPVCDRDGLSAPDDTESDAAVFDYIRGFAETILREGEQLTADIPVMTPERGDDQNTFEDVLRLHAVSKYLKASNAQPDDQNAFVMSCPYVKNDAHDPADYLVQLAIHPLHQLDNPDENEHSWPLLYRLCRLSRENLDMILPKDRRDITFDDLSASTRSSFGESDKKIQARLLSFGGALKRLANMSSEELEILLMETLDLMSHRADAWETALATFRLKHQRQNGTTGLKLGYYGFISALRTESVTGGSDGYILAPGVNQAVSSALLRSAALRFQDEEAFRINLSSARMRKAVKILSLLGKGIALGEVLGYQAERWLHNQQKDALIDFLRKELPIELADYNRTMSRRLINGLALAEADDGALYDIANTAALINVYVDGDLYDALADVRDYIADGLDAFSDLIVAEAVNQLARGDTGAANAWMRVLSGGTPPQKLDFAHIHRDGQGSSHRVSLVLNPSPTNTDTPRATVEPAFAALAEHILDGFEEATVLLSVLKLPDGTKLEDPWTTTLSLSGDLGMTPLDLVLGDQNELAVRARWVLAQRWREEEPIADELGPLPTEAITTYFTQSLSLSVDTPLLDDLLKRAADLRTVLSKSRPLTPDDVRAAASETPLPKDILAAQTADAVDALQARVDTLLGSLANTRAQLTSNTEGILDAALQLATAIENNESEDVPAELAEAYYAEIRNLNATLEAVSQYALPQALRLFSDNEIVFNPDAFAEHLSALDAALAAKEETLLRAQADVSEGVAPSEVDTLLQQTTTALQTVCDGKSLRICPPYRATSDILPDLSPAFGLPNDLKDWARLRKHLAPLEKVMNAGRGLRAWASTRRPDDSGNEFRSADKRPPSEYHGTYIGFDPGFLSAPTDGDIVAGLVLDEWSEFRPSNIQNAGLAINYDSPQNEAPNAMVLAVPEKDDADTWTDGSAAKIVLEVIKLMKHRALPSDASSFTRLEGADFNRVGPTRGEDERRIGELFMRFDFNDLENPMALIMRNLERSKKDTRRT